MKTFVPFLKCGLLSAVLMILYVITNAQTNTELVFTNAQLISGTSNQDGAVYKFNNVAAGIDAVVKIVSRSSQAVILDTIDVPPVNGMGFDKALQPQLGIHGNVPANSNWWMKFEVNFLQSGTNKSVTINKFQATALDIDGDGVSIVENLTMHKASSAAYSPFSLLKQSPLSSAICPQDGLASLSKICINCAGLGYSANGGGKQKTCKTCNGVGLLFAACNHPWLGSDFAVAGTTVNAPGIDTSAVNNMATFTYDNTNAISFTYGASSGAVVSNAGQRLNSLWFKSFNLIPLGMLPVKLSAFTAVLQKNTVDLNWTTTEEINFDHFELERSTDGISFNQDAIIFGSEQSESSVNYTYRDKNMDFSTHSLYYRLKMVDKSGKFDYSQVQIVHLGDDSNAISIVAYPNPVAQKLFLTMPSTWKGNKAVVQVYSASGIMVETTLFSNVTKIENLEISQLANGLYYINITCQNKNVMVKILKN